MLHLPDNPLLHHPRRRFVAFSAVGVAMVFLPLWQVLRYQQSDLQQLAAERALLDPVARAVHVQFGLLAHRTVSAEMLQARPQAAAARLEPARLAVQAGVDEQLQSLAQQLTQGLWAHAGAETRDLTRDWQALAQRVQAHQISAAQSNESHGLRIEQAVQVVDLVTMSDAVTGTAPTAAPVPSRFAAVARSISRLAAEVPAAGAEAGAASAGATADAPASASHRVSHRLQALQHALASAAAAQPATAPPLQAAVAEVQRSTQAALQAAASPEGVTMAAAQAAQRAQVALFEQALGQHKRALAQRQTHIEQRQLALLAALAVFSSLALALAASLWRRMGPLPTALAGSGPAVHRAPRGPGQQPAAATDAAAQSTRAEAQRVLDRLRHNTPPRSTEAQPAPREPQDTLPPGRG